MFASIAKMMFRGAKGASGFAFSAGKEAVKSIPGVARAGYRASLFALRNPYLTAGGIGSAAYILNSNKSPYDSPTLTSNLTQPNMVNQNMAMSGISEGIAPMRTMEIGYSVRNKMLMDSTMGLVQGLHRNRH